LNFNGDFREMVKTIAKRPTVSAAAAESQPRMTGKRARSHAGGRERLSARLAADLLRVIAA